MSDFLLRDSTQDLRQEWNLKSKNNYNRLWIVVAPGKEESYFSVVGVFLHVPESSGEELRKNSLKIRNW